MLDEWEMNECESNEKWLSCFLSLIEKISNFLNLQLMSSLTASSRFRYKDKTHSFSAVLSVEITYLYGFVMVNMLIFRYGYSTSTFTGEWFTERLLSFDQQFNVMRVFLKLQLSGWENSSLSRGRGFVFNLFRSISISWCFVLKQVPWFFIEDS